jgi:hypothetical protein
MFNGRLPTIDSQRSTLISQRHQRHARRITSSTITRCKDFEQRRYALDTFRTFLQCSLCSLCLSRCHDAATDSAASIAATFAIGNFTHVAPPATEQRYRAGSSHNHRRLQRHRQRQLDHLAKGEGVHGYFTNNNDHRFNANEHNNPSTVVLGASKCVLSPVISVGFSVHHQKSDSPQQSDSPSGDTQPPVIFDHQESDSPSDGTQHCARIRHLH